MAGEMGTLSSDWTIADRLWGLVPDPDPGTGCATWAGSFGSDGTPRFRVGVRWFQAARMAYASLNGEVPENRMIMKNCGRRSCLAPGHLRVSAPRPSRKGYPLRSVVYVVERDGFVKIGFTSDFTRRRKELERGSALGPGMTSGPVAVLAVVPADREYEQAVHAVLRPYRLGRSEWFHRSGAVNRFVQQLQTEQSRRKGNSP